MKTVNFDVMYERDDGALVAMPDALSRDTMDRDVLLFHRCPETLKEMTEESGDSGGLLTVAKMRTAQKGSVWRLGGEPQGCGLFDRRRRGISQGVCPRRCASERTTRSAGTGN
jgi:hypothetical protein